MGKKIFISYKYSDNDVCPLKSGLDELLSMTTARDYVDEIQTLLASDDHINKGENDGQDLSDFKNSTIASKLRDKIYDSSITIVLISPNMKECFKLESEQWIPWEISYSLRESTRADRMSKTNAVLAVILPDRNCNYDYYITENQCGDCRCTIHQTDTLFKIIRENMFNQKDKQRKECSKGSDIFLGFSSYIHTVKWSDFKYNINQYINEAVFINTKINNYEIVKTVD